MSIDAQSPPHAGTGTGAGPSTVSSSGIEAIETSLDHVEPLVQISDVPLETVYDVESTAEELLRGGWTRVRVSLSGSGRLDSLSAVPQS